MAASRVAIHQPNFFPWLGYFDKLAQADVFVFLDDVQFPRQSRGTYVNRVKVLINGEARWLTAPVQRGEGTQLIREVRTNESERWREKLPRTLLHAYRRAPSFDQVFPRIEELLSNSTDRLAEYNEAAIRALADDLGFGPELVRSSELDVEGSATDLLIAIVAAVGGDAYLSGGGAEGYQEDEKFRDAGIELIHQDFRHPAYPQLIEGSVEGLSIIDPLMSLGFEETRGLLGAT